ncbi:MAG: HD domain-containing protein [Candidatus Levyibacteriota bacterium]|jgi:hypothetical protein
MQNVDSLAEQIKNNPLFLELKGVIENNAYHDNESDYDHLIKTYEIAKEQIKGNFIKNPQAKKLFLEFTNTPLDGLTNGDVMLLTALVHDIGKILYYKEGKIGKPLRHVTKTGHVNMPGHEYWGSTIIPELLKNTGLSEKIIERIVTVVRLHDTFGARYFNPLSNWPLEEIIDDIKARAEGLYKEALFNVYCDCFSAKPFMQTRPKIEEVFNQPSLYTPREYFIK